MALPEFVKAAIREGHMFIAERQGPDYNCMDPNERHWVVIRRVAHSGFGACPGFTGLHVEYYVNGKCRRRMKNLILEADGTIY